MFWSAVVEIHKTLPPIRREALTLKPENGTASQGANINSPSSVDTAMEKQLCLDRCVTRACPANPLLFTVHSCPSRSSTCISAAQARRIWVSAAGASNDCPLVAVPCAFSHMVVTFRGRREGKLVFWSQVDFSRFSCQVQGI